MMPFGITVRIYDKGALARFKARVKELTRRNQGRSLGQVISILSAYLRGWRGYFGFCQTSSVLRDLDSWIRRRRAELIKRGIKPELAAMTAFSPKGPWRISHTPGVRMARNNQFFDQMGLIRLRLIIAFNHIEPPWCGPVCLVVWEGGSREAPPYPDWHVLLGLQPTPSTKGDTDTCHARPAYSFSR